MVFVTKSPILLYLAENVLFKVGVRDDFSKSLVVEAFICDAGNIDKIPALRGFKSMYPYLESDAKGIEFHYTRIRYEA